MQRVRSFLPALILALVAAIPVLPAALRGEVLGPWNVIRALMGQSATTSGRIFDGLQADACLQFAPWRSLVLESWAHGHVPFWNPYVLAGTPLMANSQSGALYPPHILLGLLHAPLGPSILLLAWFHLFLAGSGVSGLAQRLGASPFGGILAGAAFASSAFMFAWLGLASVPSTVAWIPWVLLGVIDAAENRPRAGIRLALSAAMMLLAGHLQFATYGMIAAVILMAGQAIASRRLVPLGKSVLCLAIGVMIAAPQVLPVIAFSKFSHRRNSPTAEGYAAYAKTAIQPFEFKGLLIPRLLGNPDQPWDSPVPGVPDTPELLTKPGGNWAESAAMGIGILALISLVFVRFDPRKRAASWSVVAIGVAGGLLAIGSIFTWLMYSYFPGWSSTGSPGRAGVLFSLAACTLAGLALREGEARTSPMFRIKLALIAFAAFAHFGFEMVLPPTGPLPDPVSAPTSGGRVAVIQGPWQTFGLPSSGTPFPPNVLTLSRIPTLGGYDSLIHRDTVDLLREIDGSDPAPGANGNMMFVKPSADAARLADAGVTEVLADGAPPQTLDSGFYWQSDVGRGNTAIRSTSGIEIDAPGAKELVVKERWMPGWSATADGKPAEIQANGPWIKVLSGGHVVLSYVAPGYALGWLIALIGTAFLLGLEFTQRHFSSQNRIDLIE